MLLSACSRDNRDRTRHHPVDRTVVLGGSRPHRREDDSKGRGMVTILALLGRRFDTEVGDKLRWQVDDSQRVVAVVTPHLLA